MNEERDRAPDLPPVVPRPIPVTPRILLRRPFGWLILGETFANLGLWAFFLATESQAAYRFGATAGQMGILLSGWAITFLLSAPWFGMLADRWRPREMLVIAYVLTIAFCAVAMLAQSLVWLYAATALFGIAHAMVWPARGALIPLLVDEDHLLQANGMVGMTWQLPLIVGPLVAGAMAARWGHGSPYIFAMASGVVAVAFYLLVPSRTKHREPTPFLRELAGGFREGFGTRTLRWLFTRSIAAWVLMGVLITLETLYVRQVLRGDQGVFGLMFALQGAGAFAASLIIARLRGGHGAEHRLIMLGLTGSGLGFLLYTGTSSMVAASAGAVFFGFWYTFFSSPSQALIQRVADQPGKVTGAYAMITEGGPLVASVAIAVAGAAVSVQHWMVWSALAFIVVGLSGAGALRRGGAAPGGRTLEPERPEPDPVVVER